MTPAFDELVAQLKRLPGLGARSAERIALHLLVEKRPQADALATALREGMEKVRECPVCGNLSDGGRCSVCADGNREQGRICVVEHVADLAAIERSGAWRGAYHVLHGKLSPIHGVGPEALNLARLGTRIASGEVSELVLALSNDIEGQATCHYIQEEFTTGSEVEVTRIGFGLPSGGGVTYADTVTLRSALEGRRSYR